MRTKNEGNCTECKHKIECIGPISLQRNCPGNVDPQDIHEDYRTGGLYIFDQAEEQLDTTEGAKRMDLISKWLNVELERIDGIEIIDYDTFLLRFKPDNATVTVTRFSTYAIGCDLTPWWLVVVYDHSFDGEIYLSIVKGPYHPIYDEAEWIEIKRQREAEAKELDTTGEAI